MGEISGNWATAHFLVFDGQPWSCLCTGGCAINYKGFPGGSDGFPGAHKAEGPGSIPGLGRYPGEGNGNPFQYSCLENFMDRLCSCKELDTTKQISFIIAILCKLLKFHVLLFPSYVIYLVYKCSCFAGCCEDSNVYIERENEKKAWKCICTQKKKYTF